MRRLAALGVVLPLLLVLGLSSGAAAATVTVIVPAGQTSDASKPTLTGAGQYSYFAPTFDRAAKNNYPNRARLLGEVYLGDGGATATYTIKALSPAPAKFSLWIFYSDDGLHPVGSRTVTLSIPALNWSTEWSGDGKDTSGWKAAKIGTVTTAGNFTVSFRKNATTSAALVMNAFAFTTGASAPAFGAAPAAATAPPPGLWRLSINSRTYRFAAIPGGFEQRTVAARKSDLGCMIGAGTAVYRYIALGSGTYQFKTLTFEPRKGGPGAAGTNCVRRWTTSKASLRIAVKATKVTVACIQSTVKANTEAYACYTGTYARVGP